MPFSDQAIIDAWKKAGGGYPPNPSICKCDRTTHIHKYRTACDNLLVWANKGIEEPVLGTWVAHYKDGNPNNNTPDNCEVLCSNCYKLATITPL